MRNLNPLQFGVLRFFLYTLALFAFLFALPWLVQPGDASLFKEGAPIEWLQALFVLLSSGFFVAAGYKHLLLRHILFVFALVVLMVFVRELDSYFDEAYPVISWKGPATFLLLCVLVIVYSGKRTIQKQTFLMMQTQVFGILWAGAAIVVIFAQLMGHGEFLASLMGDDYDRDYKRVIEETTELLGYFIVLVASVESIFLFKDSRKPTPLLLTAEEEQPPPASS